MNLKTILVSIPMVAIVVLGLATLLIGPKTVYASTTTFGGITTINVVGWLAPDSTHLTNGLMPMLFPLGGVGAFAWIARTFKVQGDAAVYMVLFGLLLGSIGADLTVGGGASTQYVPFALIVVAAILLFLWWWNS